MEQRDTVLSRFYRLWVTGASFALFGIGGLILGLLVIPVLLLLPGGAERRRNRIRTLVQLAFRFFVEFMHGLRGLSYEIHGQERLGRPGQLVIANHPTLIDVVLIIAFTPMPGCVVKAALFRNPYMRRVLQAAGYIPNSPTDTMIERASAALQGGECLVMFPEGTRSRPGEPLVFHRGTAAVAVRAARVLTPVYIRCEPIFLTKGTPWYRIPPRRPHLTVEVGDDIDLSVYHDNPPPRASRQLNDWLLAHYTERLAGARGYNGTRREREA
jgi:1-acyl-sn-glycerol-3-phosphate acyltransferase